MREERRKKRSVQMAKKEEVRPDGSRWARGGGLRATRWDLWRRDVRAEGRGKRAEKRRKSEERRERREVERVTWQGSMAKKKVGP